MVDGVFFSELFQTTTSSCVKGIFAQNLQDVDKKIVQGKSAQLSNKAEIMYREFESQVATAVTLRYSSYDSWGEVAF